MLTTSKPRWLLLASALCLALTASACGDDAPIDDAGLDAGPTDTGPADTGPTDTGPTDTGPTDTGMDAGPVDTGVDAGPVDTGTAQGIVIAHTNDEHSHMLGFAPNVDDFPTPAASGDGIVGGLKRRSTVISNIRGSAQDDVLLLQAGDSMMGTMFHIANLFIGVDFVSLSLLGYNAITLGNHEFDFGPGILANAIANGALEAGGTATDVFDRPIVVSNIRFSMEDAADDELAALYGDVANGQPLVRTYIETVGELRVGYFGLMGLDASLVAPFKQPVRFSIATDATTCTSSADCGGRECLPPATDPTATTGNCAVNTDESDVATHFPALVADAASAIAELRAQNVDLVVLLSHVGVDDRELATLEAMGLPASDAQVSEEIILAKALDPVMAGLGMKAIDLIVGGHSHTPLDAPLQIPMVQSGHNTYIVQAGSYGRFVGEIRLTRPDPTANWELDANNSRLNPVDDTSPQDPNFGIVADILLNGIIDALEGSPAASAGDGLIFPGEQCDTIPGGGFEFPNNSDQCIATIPGATGGTLACFNNRQLDTAGCNMFFAQACGDNTITVEPCDGPALAGATCATLGYAGDAAGTNGLSCNANCTFNVSNCTPRFPSLLEIAVNFGQDINNPVGTYTIFDDPNDTGDLWLHQMGTASFDVGEKVDFNESNLANFVTDAERWSMNQLADFNNQEEPDVEIVINSNGVIRDGLYHGKTDALSMADLFRVMPLGVSPGEQTPGFPMVDFYFPLPEVKAGIEVGLSSGLQSDSFWLVLSGVHVEYDLSLPAFDPANPTTTGRVTKLTMLNGNNEAWDDSSANGQVVFDITNTQDPFLGNATRMIHVGTSFYVALFMEALGLCPRLDSGITNYVPDCAPCTTNTDCRADLNLTCDQTAGRCTGGVPAAFRTRTLVPANSQEVKEFLSLTTYVRNLPNQVLPTNYNQAVPRRLCCVGSACPSDGSRSCN